MTTVTYTAKRNIVTVDFGVSGTDISASDADNSFNASTTDLSGLNANEWIKVTGSASNDGWHQVSEDSTTSKIKVTSTLTTEAAGENIAIDGYLHGKDEEYTLEFDVKALTPSSEEVSDESVAINGNTEGLFHREDFFWDATTANVDESDKPLWDEFFSSVRGKQSFVFDAYGTVASPDNQQNVVLAGNQRFQRLGNRMIYNIVFKVRVL